MKDGLLPKEPITELGRWIPALTYLTISVILTCPILTSSTLQTSHSPVPQATGWNQLKIVTATPNPSCLSFCTPASRACCLTGAWPFPILPYRWNFWFQAFARIPNLLETTSWKTIRRNSEKIPLAFKEDFEPPILDACSTMRVKNSFLAHLSQQSKYSNIFHISSNLANDRLESA